jgi:hypothetical protein
MQPKIFRLAMTSLARYILMLSSGNTCNIVLLLITPRYFILYSIPCMLSFHYMISLNMADRPKHVAYIVWGIFVHDTAGLSISQLDSTASKATLHTRPDWADFALPYV